MPVCSSVRPSVCVSAWNKSYSNGRVFINLFWISLRKSVLEIKKWLNSVKVTGTLYLDLCTIMIKCHSFIFKIKTIVYNLADLFKTHIICLLTFSWNCYMSWDNAEHFVAPGRRETTLHTQCVVWFLPCWIFKSTDTHWENIMFNPFFRE